MITLRNLTSPAATDSKVRIDAINQTIHEGETVSVCGGSSMSRRRLLAVIGLYAHDWSGEYELYEHKIHKLDDAGRARLRTELVGAFMSCSPLVDCLTVEENLEIPLSYHHVTGVDRHAVIDDVLGRLGIPDVRPREVTSLLPGESQLVGIAKALVSEPRLVLLDEPSRDLSPLQARLVGREIGRLGRSGSIVVQAVERAEDAVTPGRVIDLGIAKTRKTASSSFAADDRVFALR